MFHVKHDKIQQERRYFMDKSQFFEEFSEIFCRYGLSEYATREISDKMLDMVERLLAVNASMNLTAITDPRDILVKHLADSCTVLPYIPKGATVCDVGCGGGFPSIPIAIARPDITVTGIDSTGKKVNYINETASVLGLSNLSAICGRAEDLAKTELRQSFDVVTARAVAALPMLCELCIPFVRVGGTFCAMKGNPEDSEIQAACSAYRRLGAPLEDENIHRFSLEGETRVILVAEKRTDTPKEFPRAFPQIKKKPL